jgi:hypothetical protein
MATFAERTGQISELPQALILLRPGEPFEVFLEVSVKP